MQSSLQIMRGGGGGGAESPDMSGSQESSYLCHSNIWVNCWISWFGFFGELDGLEGEFCSTIECKVRAVKEGRSQGLGMTREVCGEGFQ